MITYNLGLEVGIISKGNLRDSGVGSNFDPGSIIPLLASGIYISPCPENSILSHLYAWTLQNIVSVDIFMTSYWKILDNCAKSV